ncbi:hypothetical protein [Pyrodictium delaneyi]|nr:hypothetical protein [Pyrodictium delaneyi]
MQRKLLFPDAAPRITPQAAAMLRPLQPVVALSTPLARERR